MQFWEKDRFSDGALLPPLLAISCCFSGFIDANPHFEVLLTSGIAASLAISVAFQQSLALYNAILLIVTHKLGIIENGLLDRLGSSEALPKSGVEQLDHRQANPQALPHLQGSSKQHLLGMHDRRCAASQIRLWPESSSLR